MARRFGTRSTWVAMAAGSAITLAAGGLAVTVGTGAFATSSPSPAPSSSADPSPGGSDKGSDSSPDRAQGKGGPGGRHGGDGRRGGMGGGVGGGMGGGIGGMRGAGGTGPVLHGELVVQDGTATRTVLVQHGTVSAENGSTLTVKSSDGFTVTWTTNSTTKGSLDEVEVGDTVGLRGTKTGANAATADVVHEPGARAQGRPSDSTPKSPTSTATPSASASTT